MEKTMVYPTLEIEPEYRLRYHLHNTQPVELCEFTASLMAIHNEYQAFAKSRGVSGTDVKLHVHHIENGSLIVDLAEYAAVGLLPFVDNVMTVVEFAKFLKEVLSWKCNTDDIPYSKQTLENCVSMVQPVAVDPGSHLELGVFKGGQVFNNCVFNISNDSANSYQNNARRAIGLMKEERPSSDTAERVLLKIHQMKAANTSNSADKGIIEAISNEPKKLLLDNEVKQGFVFGTENPFTKLYYVDVIPLYSSGKLVAYRVTRVHESFEP